MKSSNHNPSISTKNLELVYWTDSGGIELPLEDWQYAVIAQVLGLSIVPEKDGGVSVSCFAKDFVMKRMEKMGVLIPAEWIKK